MNNKRGLFLLFIAAYYLVIAGIFLNRLNAEPPVDKYGFLFSPCFLPNPVGEWHHQTNRIYFVCVICRRFLSQTIDGLMNVCETFVYTGSKV